MMKIGGTTLFHYKKFTFGDFTARQFILFEHKKLFGMLFFFFTGNGWQDRFHTHAFNALSIKLFGTYKERVFTHSRPVAGAWTVSERRSIFKYFPRDSYHCLGHSKGCMTFLISGPWKPTWKEWRDGQEYELGWHRKRL